MSSPTTERLTPERCSATSGALDEPLAGTASTVRSWLLLQHPGPWGRDAFLDGRHAVDGFGAELAARCAASRVRPLLIRRVDRDLDLERFTVFAIRSGPGEPRVERTSFASAGDALGLDLEALGRGEALGFEPHDEPLFLVCTHGRHDPCCVEQGRPLAFALSEVFPDATWECSHLGGDRFAANLLAFPHGYVFGRVEPSDGERVARAYLDGRLSLEHLRGRTCVPMAEQFAEHALRKELELDGIDEVRFEDASRAGDTVSATFSTPAGTATVSLVVDIAAPRFLTCHSSREEAPPAYRVTSILLPS